MYRSGSTEGACFYSIVSLSFVGTIGGSPTSQAPSPSELWEHGPAAAAIIRRDNVVSQGVDTN